MGCGNITRGSSADCESLPIGGTRARLILINSDDIATTNGIEENGDSKITDINLLTGRSGYEFVGFRNDMKNIDEVASPEIGLNQFIHQTSWVIYERTQAQKNNIEKLARGRFYAIVELKGGASTGDPDAVIFLGRSVGLEILPGVIRDAYASAGLFTITLKTPEGEFEGKLPQTVGTSYSNAQTIIDNVVAGS